MGVNDITEIPSWTFVRIVVLPPVAGAASNQFPLVVTPPAGPWYVWLNCKYFVANRAPLMLNNSRGSIINFVLIKIEL